MLSFDPKKNKERENYKLLTGSIIPRPIAFITSATEDGTVNGAPFSYFNVVTSNPPMISVALQRKDGKRKDTARNILAQKEFVVHIVDEDNVEKVNQTAASFLPEQSEVEKAGLTVVPSEKIAVPGIQEAKVRMECILEQVMEVGEANEIGADLIIGKVIRIHVDEKIYENGRINPDELRAVARLAGSNYARLGERFSLIRPE